MSGFELNSRLDEIDHSKIKSPHKLAVGIFLNLIEKKENVL